MLENSRALCRQALLQSEGYQKTQQALAARLQTLNQAAEADQAIIEEVHQALAFVTRDGFKARASKVCFDRNALAT